MEEIVLCIFCASGLCDDCAGVYSDKETTQGQWQNENSNVVCHCCGRDGLKTLLSMDPLIHAIRKQQQIERTKK